MKPESSAKRFPFPKSIRLRRSAEFQKVYREGKRWANDPFAVIVRERTEGGARFGFTTARNIGSAVKRNRAKRLMREVVRLNQHRFREGIDVVVSARKGADSLRYSDVEDRLIKLFCAGKLWID